MNGRIVPHDHTSMIIDYFDIVNTIVPPIIGPLR
jgi:hypothetical protein